MFCLKSKSTAFFFFLMCQCTDLLHPSSTSFTGTRVNCCLTCAVTLPNAIYISPSQIHYYTIPLVGKGFAMCQPRPQIHEGKSINLVLGQKRKKKKKKGLHQCLLICKKRSDLQSLYERVFDGALLLCQCSTCCRHWHPLLPSRSLARLSGRRASSPMTRP